METTKEQKEMLIAIHSVDPFADDYQKGVNFGIEETLDVLGIKIKEINDYIKQNVNL